MIWILNEALHKEDFVARQRLPAQFLHRNVLEIGHLGREVVEELQTVRVNGSDRIRESCVIDIIGLEYELPSLGKRGHQILRAQRHVAHALPETDPWFDEPIRIRTQNLSGIGLLDIEHRVVPQFGPRGQLRIQSFHGPRRSAHGIRVILIGRWY